MARCANAHANNLLCVPEQAVRQQWITSLTRSRVFDPEPCLAFGLLLLAHARGHGHVHCREGRSTAHLCRLPKARHRKALRTARNLLVCCPSTVRGPCAEKPVGPFCVRSGVMQLSHVGASLHDIYSRKSPDSGCTCWDGCCRCPFNMPCGASAPMASVPLCPLPSPPVEACCGGTQTD